MFEVVTPADDLNLLTIEELRVAVGLESDDDSQDAALETLGDKVSSIISAACLIIKDGVSPPTLLLEGCAEEVRISRPQKYIFLSRRPIWQMISVTVSGTLLTQDIDFEVDLAYGKLTRLRDDTEICWDCGKVVVEYDAGYDDVPADLKAIAAQLASRYWASDGSDPLEKRVDIPDVIEIDRWVDPTSDPQMPKDLFDALVRGGYVNQQMVL